MSSGRRSDAELLAALDQVRDERQDLAARDTSPPARADRARRVSATYAREAVIWNEVSSGQRDHDLLSRAAVRAEISASEQAGHWTAIADNAARDEV